MGPLFVGPKVHAQDVVEFFGVCEVDDSAETRDGDSVDRSVFGRSMVVLLDLIPRSLWSCDHFDHVAEKRVSLGSFKVGARTDTVGSVAVFDENVEDISPNGLRGVGPCKNPSENPPKYACCARSCHSGHCVLL
jgi:hypothetical protein